MLNNVLSLSLFWARLGLRQFLGRDLRLGLAGAERCIFLNVDYKRDNFVMTIWDSPMDIWGSPKEIWGSSLEIWGTPMKMWESPMEIWGSPKEI